MWSWRCGLLLGGVVLLSLLRSIGRRGLVKVYYILGGVVMLRSIGRCGPIGRRGPIGRCSLVKVYWEVWSC